MELRGVRVHNLQGIDVTIPWGQWTAISGVSGSGKSSLAFDTLFAEGQRRYLESLSPGARQFLEQLPQPDADHIDPLPPAIAIRQNARWRPGTVGSATEISHYLRLLFARVGKILCPDCDRPVRRQTPQDVLDEIHTFPPGRRFQIAFPARIEDRPIAEWIELGFTRGIIAGSTVNFPTDAVPEDVDDLLVLVDRLSAGKSPDERVLDSLEQAFSAGEGDCLLLVEAPDADAEVLSLDGTPWGISRFSDQWKCDRCQRLFLEPEPRLFNPNSPAGACPTCDGRGTVSELNLDQLVPEPGRRLDEGAIACFQEPVLASEEADWLKNAQVAGLPIDLPFAELNTARKTLLLEGNPQAEFRGLRDLFDDLAGQTGKPSVQTFLGRWLLPMPCPECGGQRLRPEALAVRIGTANIAEVSDRPIAEFRNWLETIPELLTPGERDLMAVVLAELQSRCESLLELGLGYLTLNHSLATISGGEAQRVALGRLLGQPLVNSLYIFDEPSAGLHPADCEPVVRILKEIQEADNTLIVVEHRDAFLNAADHLIDLGPGAGAEGGRVVFQGPPAKLREEENSLTGRYIGGRESVHRPFKPQAPGKEPPRLVLQGVNRFPFQGADVEFPLNSLCVITGVSGSGKTVLLEQVLEPALKHALGQPVPRSERERFQSLQGSEAIEEVVRLDQTPLAGSTRSNPVTYLNVFDEIRRLFAETPEAQKQGFGLKDFSFNSPSGGRCPACQGQGTIEVEMQFLSGLSIVCPECQGTRYRPEILSARYRGLHIGEVLNLTVAQAFTFFRTQPKIRKRLQVLKDVGLDYLPLGQPTGTLSGGESQRLKLAGFLSESRPACTLFLFDEPTLGLHPADVQTLVNCFDYLLSVGHSVIIAEHNLHLIRQADWIIDLGPGPGHAGGRILATGPPEQVAENAESLTGQWLKSRRFGKPGDGKTPG